MYKYTFWEKDCLSLNVGLSLNLGLDLETSKKESRYRYQNWEFWIYISVLVSISWLMKVKSHYWSWHETDNYRYQVSVLSQQPYYRWPWLESTCFCDLGAHTKMWNPSCLLSGRKWNCFFFFSLILNTISNFCSRRWGSVHLGHRMRDPPLSLPSPSTWAEIFRHGCLQSRL